MGKGISNEIQGLESIQVHQVTGSLDAAGNRFAIVVSRFNDELTGALCTSAVDCLLENGAAPKDVEVYWVPGAYEIPVIANQLARKGDFDAIIVLGVVVEGETQHAQMIIDTTGQSILDIAREHSVPVINEIVGVRTWDQATARCLGGKNTRGWYAAEAAIETVQVIKQI